MEVGLSLRAQRAQDATGFKQRGAKPLGELAKRFAIADSVDSAGELHLDLDELSRDMTWRSAWYDGAVHPECICCLAQSVEEIGDVHACPPARCRPRGNRPCCPRCIPQGERLHADAR